MPLPATSGHAQRSANFAGAIDLIFVFLAAATVFLLTVNVIASRRIVGDESSTGGQRAAQLVLVWVVPIVGALLVFQLTPKHFNHRSERGRTVHWSGDDTIADTEAARVFRDANQSDLAHGGGHGEGIH
jgi:hypothetical protein